MSPESKRLRLRNVTTRLFDLDIRQIKRIAALEATPWQTRLRLLVHRAVLELNQEQAAEHRKGRIE